MTESAMSEKIVLPTDFSEYARMTARLVSEIPGVSEVVLLHVIEGKRVTSPAWAGSPDTAAARASAEQSLQEEGEEIARGGVTVRSEIVTCERGGTAAAILSVAHRETADLIMIGARGKGLVEGLLLGSVSSEVLRYATTSVLLVRHPPAWSSATHVRSTGERGRNRLFSRVLYPVDFSKPCDEGFAFIRSIQGIEEIILLHVITQADTRQELQGAIRESYQELQALWDSFDNGRTRVTILLRFGRPADMIVDIAEKQGATLIFMPRFGASDFIKTLPIGSTAKAVAQQTRIPLFLFYPEIILDVVARELERDEFPGAEEVWRQDWQQKADPGRDRVFGVLVEGVLVTVARCRRTHGFLEVDSVFTIEEFRKRGYAREVLEQLVSSCGQEPLYLYSTLPMVAFARQLGFDEIVESDLPPAVRDRLNLAREMGDGPVVPMMRPAVG